MKNLKLSTILLGTQLLISNLALSTVINADCISNPNDPYDLGYVMDVGENKGECMATHARPVMQTEESLSRPIYKNSVQLANVSHKGEFYTAEIPMHGIEDVIFQVETFEAPVPAAHTQIRLKFLENSPVTLINQDPTSENSEFVTHNLIFSVEAIGEEGYEYDIFKGLGKNMKTVYRVKTLEGFVERVVVGKGSQVKQWKMKLDKSEKRKLLMNYTFYSAKKGFSDIYNTVKLNCTIELLRIVDQSTRNSFRKSFGKLITLDLYPAVVKPALISRGLVSANGSSDLEDLANDPTIAHMLD